MMVVSSPDPQTSVQLTIDFVNTLDFETGEDRLDTPAGLGAWLHEHALPAPARPSARQHGQAIELREALRATMYAHNGGADDAAAAAVLDAVAVRGELSVRFHPGGAVALAPRRDGFDGALAGLLVPVAGAVADGSWERVKACAADDCRWAFFDQSRNRSGRWCNMAVCGNRVKVRAYRDKRSPG